jgi:type II secretory pathway pseudopilin PulG
VSRRAFTLLEVIIANFLLLFMLLTIMSIFTMSGRPAASNRNTYRASALAEKKLEEIRCWAFSHGRGRYNFENFGSAADPFNGTDSVDPDYPEFVCHTDGKWQQQTTYAAVLHRSLRKLRVSVRWQEGAVPQHYDVMTMLGEPARPLASITLLPNQTQNVHVGDTLTFTAQGYDGLLDPIPDLTYEWTVMGRTADGRVVRQHGPRATFKATAVAPGVSSGECTLRVSASSAGVMRYADTATIKVSP